MNTKSTRCNRLMIGNLLVGALLLVNAALNSGRAGRVDKLDKKGMIKMIDDIANRNQAPKLVGEDRLEQLPLFPAHFDWEEQKRVKAALYKLDKQMTAEMWELLVSKADDPSYSLTIKNNSGTFALGNYTVGAFCRSLASDWLVGVFAQHLPVGPEGRKLALDIGIRTRNLAEWRKQRKVKSLAELQVEVCELALQRLANDKQIPQNKKDAARRMIEAEIRQLRKTKRPVFVESSLFLWVDTYSAEKAKALRELIEEKKK